MILAIETSCDETALAVLDVIDSDNKLPQFDVVNEITISQIDVHKEFGGVVPFLAKREHIKNLPILFEKLNNGKWNMDSIDYIAVTVGPGLEPALWTGINFAKELGDKYNKKIIGVNHLHGHMYSFLLSPEIKNIEFPSIMLLVSGGHTILIKMDSLTDYKKLGETRDDAVGESFDKVARILGLKYPGGPAIEKLAQKGDEKSIKLPMPMINSNDYDFSYSGLKTAVLYYLKDKGVDLNNFSPKPSEEYIKMLDEKGISRSNLSASFQRVALGVLVEKTIRAVEEFGAKSVFMGGGVSANRKLKEMMETKLKEKNLENTKVFVPPIKYCMDNASMIAVASYMSDKKINYPLEANGLLDV